MRSSIANQGVGLAPQRTYGAVATERNASSAGPTPPGTLSVVTDGAGGTQIFTPGGQNVTPKTQNSGGYQTSAPPDSPEVAQENARLKHQNGELLQAIGSIREEMALQMEEMALRMEAGMGGAIPNQAPGINLPAGVSPDAPVNVGQLMGILQSAYPTIMANAARSSWDITAQEEAQAIHENPAINQAQEPRKTDLIRKQVALIRRRNAKTQAPQMNQHPAQPAHQVTPAQSNQQMRPAQPTIATPEVSSPPQSASYEGEGGVYNETEDVAQAANTEYYRLKAKLAVSRDQKERRQLLAGMKQQMKIVRDAQGVTEEQMGQSSWTQR